MEVNVYKLDGNVAERMALPQIFSGEFREEIVRRALLSEQSAHYQPQAHYVLAGLQTTAVYVGKYSGYRRGRHMGIAIRPRQKLGGGAMGDVRRIPSSVKGRRAHPHKLGKMLNENMNKREYEKAIRSALSSLSMREMIKKRHSVEIDEFPIVVEDNIEEITKSKELLKVLSALGLSKDLGLSRKPALKRGRRAQRRHFRKSVLLVVKNTAKVERAGRNIPGVDVCGIERLEVGKLAPGAKPRLSVWSKGAANGVEGIFERAR